VRGALSEYVLERSDEMPEAAVAAASGVQPDGGEFRVMVPLANPETESDLISLASAVAKRHGGTVDAVHIVQVPDQTSLQAAAERFDDERSESEALLDSAKESARSFGVDVETSTIFSHRTYEEVFDAARSHEADLVVMGWGPDAHGSPGRAESAYDDLVESLPCDFLVLQDRGFDTSRVLFPTAGGPDSDLGAETAAALQAAFGSDLVLLHVADDVEEGERFLEEWADEHDLSEAERRVVAGNPSEEIRRAAADCSLLVMGATERGLVSRLFGGSSPASSVVEKVDCSVLLAEKAHHRSLRERLFGG
jgi:nucleotide-binding universal stress UspA family protein